jgi:hypothetical protein
MSLEYLGYLRLYTNNKCFAAGFSTYPCHMAFIACLMTAFLCFAQAIVQTFLATNASQRELKRA